MRKFRTGLIVMAILILISFLTIQAETSDIYFNYLKSVYDKHDRDLAQFLQAELEAYLAMYPDNQHSPEATYLLGQVFNERGREHRALAMFMKSLLVYPNSAVKPMAYAEVRRIIADERAYQEKSEDIIRIIDGEITGADFTDRYFGYLTFLREINIDRLYDWTIMEFYRFLTKYKDDQRCEKIHRWIADYYNLNDDPEASVAAYLKYEQLYPESPHLAYVKVNRADVLYRKLKDYPSAVAVLTNVIDNYPQTEQAGSALSMRAEIKNRRLKDPNGAIDDYRRLVTEMPSHARAVEALMAIAEISADELKAYRAAITAYSEVVENYPADIQGVEALQKSARLHMKLKEAHNAAEKYAQVAIQFPDYEKSPEMLFEAADIADDKLKDLPKAVEYLEMIVSQYPDSEPARKAREKIEKYQEKLGE